MQVFSSTNALNASVEKCKGSSAGRIRIPPHSIETLHSYQRPSKPTSFSLQTQANKHVRLVPKITTKFQSYSRNGAKPVPSSRIEHHHRAIPIPATKHTQTGGGHDPNPRGTGMHLPAATASSTIGASCTP